VIGGVWGRYDPEPEQLSKMARVPARHKKGPDNAGPIGLGCWLR
jgi:hypothetical protein